ncbi:hypothetical protein ACBR40_27260 [Nonomuraea sp. AD125B]|uniref:hypothetical protein n=1 Tax=Nonomuraea sp. AD125B TaxID=3242897 RepID=UPI00352803F1
MTLVPDLDADPRTLGSQWLFKQEADYNTVPDAPNFAAFAKAVLTCANGDGEIAAAERAWVIGFFAALGASPDLLAELRDYPATQDVNELVGSSPAVAASTRALIYHALRACSADGGLHSAELTAIRAMNAHLGHPADLVDQWLELHQEEQRLRARRLELIWPDPTAKPY